MPRPELGAVVRVQTDALEDTAGLLTLRLVALDADALNRADAVDPGVESGTGQRQLDDHRIHAIGDFIGDGVRVWVTQVRLAPRLLPDPAAEVEADADGRILDVMEIQLRDYRIRQGHMGDWIAGWERGIVPVREREGFQIVGAWVDRPNDRFVWVVGYAGADGFAAAEERYHASSARFGLDPNPSDFVASATLDMVVDALAPRRSRGR